VKSAAVTVGTTATLLVPADDYPRTVYLHVVGNSTVYLGNSGVTTTNGLATEKHTAPLTFFVPKGETIYAIVAADTANVRILTPDVD
jgi:hypothetical protein